MSVSSRNGRVSGAAACAGLAVIALLIHGYHMGTDDAGIWAPAIKKAADPSLYPFGDEFFLSHAHLSLFPYLLGTLARLTHLPADVAIFLCHIVGVFLLLLAGWQLLTCCFDQPRARLAGVALLAAVLSVPVAGTAIPIMDPYVTSRTLSTPFAVFAIAGYLSGRLRRGLLWLGACAAMHPQMSLYAAALMSIMAISGRYSGRARKHPAFALASLCVFPFLWDLAPARGAARIALLSREYFFVSNWAWYEWFGVAAPLVLLWYCNRVRLQAETPRLRNFPASVVLFGVCFAAAGLLLSASPRFENYTRLQPMRAFQLVYILMFLLSGGLAGEHLLKNKRSRWAVAFVPLAAGMWLVARTAFPSSPHIEWPGAKPRQEWSSAFLWIREHTPKDAVFALDPGYLLAPGEDMHGFRAVAERSALADRVKDSGVVSLFPRLADDWDEQVHAQTGWDSLSRADFRKMAQRYPVTWIVTRRGGPEFNCPYRSTSLAVCRIPPR